jgi:hypothetical protein
MIEARAIIPRKIDTAVFMEEFTEAVKKTIDSADVTFKKTYSTWQNKPDFIKSIDASSTKIVGLITTEDNKYRYVTRGTAVRYATMTTDFVAKTQPRVLGSGAGRGGLLYVDKRRPRPGIKAREFEEMVQDQEEPKFSQRVEQAANQAAKKSGHSI